MARKSNDGFGLYIRWLGLGFHSKNFYRGLKSLFCLTSFIAINKLYQCFIVWIKVILVWYNLLLPNAFHFDEFKAMQKRVSN